MIAGVNASWSVFDYFGLLGLHPAFGVYERYTKSANENQRLMLLEQKNDLDYEHFKLLQMDYNNTRAIIPAKIK